MSISISKFLINQDSTLEKAIKLINISSHKCLFVIDSKKKFIGTISDGDIRKYLIKNLNLNVSIKNVYNKNPKKVYTNSFNIDDIKKIFNDDYIDLLPVLNNKDRVVSIFSWRNLIDISKDNNHSNSHIFILAGAKGTRLLPLTNKIPKPLIEIDGEPMIKKIIDKFRNQGFEKLYISVNHEKKKVISFLKAAYKEQNFRIDFINENKELGTIGSLRLIKDKQKVNNYIVINCDTLISYDFNNILKFHSKKNADITVLGSKSNISLPYGKLIDNKHSRILNIFEKPNIEINLNVGCYIINKNIIKLIPSNKKFDAPELILKAIKKRLRVFSYNISMHDWTEIGTKADFINFKNIINGS